MKIVDGVRRYNAWVGNPGGTAEDSTRCIEEVYPNDGGGWARYHQCTRKRGHGPEGLYCKQHSPEAAEARKAAVDARAKRWTLGFSVDGQRRTVSEIARRVFRQEASFDDLEAAVGKLEQLIAERDGLRP